MLLIQLAAAVASGLAIHGAGASPVLASKRYVPATHSLHERHEPQQAAHWSRRSKVPSSALLPVRIGLAQGNLQAGHERLLAISDKTSEHYGKHMTAEEVIDFFAPPQSLVDAVADWVSSAGISRERIGHSANKQWLQFDATAKEVEELLYAEFHVWQHKDGFEDISTDAYHVPSHIKEHIDYITPGTRLRAIKRTAEAKGQQKKQRRSGDLNIRPEPLYRTSFKGQPDPFVINATSCDVNIVADCLRQQYGITQLQGKAQPGNELGIFESLDDHYSKHDLDVFFSTLYPHIPNGTYPIEKGIDGAVGAVEEATTIPIDAGPGGESSLDFDSAIPLIYPQKTVLFQTDDEWYEQDQVKNTTKFFGFYNTFLDAIDGSYCSYQGGNCNTADCLDPTYPDPNPGGYKGNLQCGVYKPTNVISVSYGASGLPDNYIRRQCHELMKLGLQGTTVIASSGDDGVGRPGTCPLGAAGQPVFYTNMLAECPYALSVGSTELNRFNNTNGYPTAPPTGFEKLDEIATRRFFSGGGFSNAFDAPEWQKAAVAKYFSANTPQKLGFTGYDQPVKDSDFSKVKGNARYYKHGRGYPDIAAIGDRQVVYFGGLWYHIGGTSLSAPVVASMVTLVNEERLKKGKGPVGFFTPALYANPSVLHDITVGSAAGCNTTGFPAGQGWDPVSGWGSPIFPKFSALLQSL
ncbi:peptidase S8/S53 domain-containing protein [Microdochium trichocladiopsis]|uniref:tripeptidyl-peptidase II n=1 Tax=Microdochium trichocladiopsis TaxID=1682393 RepID=A0A9P8YG72_9PEZI|nr:peptidase S8/S53 domain-containing protein [Microdochium trichocladiopsis]KAH7038297.1 peptidase S8/S53 domain-containing protein [Microdochium trichocladiopsis]